MPPSDPLVSRAHGVRRALTVACPLSVSRAHRGSSSEMARSAEPRSVAISHVAKNGAMAKTRATSPLVSAIVELSSCRSCRK